MLLFYYYFHPFLREKMDHSNLTKLLWTLQLPTGTIFLYYCITYINLYYTLFAKEMSLESKIIYILLPVSNFFIGCFLVENKLNTIVSENDCFTKR